MDISFKTKEHPEPVTVSYDVPDTLEGLTERFGAETVASAAKGQIVISLQAFGRRHIEKSQAEIQELVGQWSPDTRMPATKKTALERATSAVSSMTAEERAELFNKLKAQLGG